MSRYKRADFSGIKTISIRSRKSKVTPADFAVPFDGRNGTFASFLDTLPDILVARDLKRLVTDILNARGKGKPVILMMGAHVIKVGLSPIVIDLVKRDLVTTVAMNSASAIHDVETAIWGKTSEDVGETIKDGKFGMARETGEFMNNTLADAFRNSDLGFGEAIGRNLLSLDPPNVRHSILATCYSLGVPVTVHAAIGTDIVHQQPTMNGAATGELSFRDFRVLCECCKGLVGGGVVLNIGSAVIMPEVFLKALTVARNLGKRARGFTTAVFDMNVHYRPSMNVMKRPTEQGGRGYYFTGHHEIMVPLLAAMLSAGGVGKAKRRSRR
jgi:hypothetical protein